MCQRSGMWGRAPGRAPSLLQHTSPLRYTHRRRVGVFGAVGAPQALVVLLQPRTLLDWGCSCGLQGRGRGLAVGESAGRGRRGAAWGNASAHLWAAHLWLGLGQRGPARRRRGHRGTGRERAQGCCLRGVARGGRRLNSGGREGRAVGAGGAAQWHAGTQGRAPARLQRAGHLRRQRGPAWRWRWRKRRCERGAAAATARHAAAHAAAAAAARTAVAAAAGGLTGAPRPGHLCRVLLAGGGSLTAAAARLLAVSGSRRTRPPLAPALALLAPALARALALVRALQGHKASSELHTHREGDAAGCKGPLDSPAPACGSGSQEVNARPSRPARAQPRALPH